MLAEWQLRCHSTGAKDVTLISELQRQRKEREGFLTAAFGHQSMNE